MIEQSLSHRFLVAFHLFHSTYRTPPITRTATEAPNTRAIKAREYEIRGQPSHHRICLKTSGGRPWYIFQGFHLTTNAAILRDQRLVSQVLKNYLHFLTPWAESYEVMLALIDMQ